MTFRDFLSFYYPKLVGTLGMRLVLMIFMQLCFCGVGASKNYPCRRQVSDINLVITRRAQPHYECSFESGLR